jgi:hypothetical protein
MCIVNGKVLKREERRPTSSKKETGPAPTQDARIRTLPEEPNAIYVILLNQRILSI